MKIIFMGTPGFAVPSLEILLKNNYNIPSVVTTPDTKKGRGLHLEYSEIKKFSLANNLEILQPDNLKDESFLNELKQLNPDLIIVVAFRILPKEVFTIPCYGSVNLHASLLPQYRGAAPINRALIRGEKETGVTTFFLKEKVDTGNIILQSKIEITESDNAGSLQNKLSLLGADVLLETVKQIDSGNVNLKIQDETLASSAPKIFKKDCIINWNSSPDTIHNLIRGLSPYPAAFTYLNGRVVKIYKAQKTDFQIDILPGKIFYESGKLYAGTGQNPIEILELQMEGRKKITSGEFINGLKKNTEYVFLNN